MFMRSLINAVPRYRELGKTLSRLVATNRVAEAYGLVCSAVRLMLFVTFAAQLCMTLAGVEAVVSCSGAYSLTDLALRMRKPREPYLRFSASVLAVGASQTVIRTQASTHLAAHGCQLLLGP